MFEMNKTPHYNFAHLALPILALGNPRKFYKDLFRSTGTNYLLSIWAGIEARMQVKQPSLGLKLDWGLPFCAAS